MKLNTMTKMQAEMVAAVLVRDVQKYPQQSLSRTWYWVLDAGRPQST